MRLGIQRHSNRVGIVAPLATAFAVAALVVAGCGAAKRGPSSPGAPQPVREVTLLATTDFHGAVVAGGRDRRTDRPWGGAVALATIVRRERAAHPQRTFLLDGGDEMQGTPESNLVFGRSSIAILNALGVDAAALGNHEFDWGLDTLRARRRDMRYPMLAANVFERASGRRPDWVRPWTMLERDGVRIGVIGFATPETPRVTLPTNVESLRFDAPEPLVPGLVRELRERGADLVVVVAHIGGTQESDGTIRGDVAALARADPSVDAVIGGHTHTFVAGMVDSVPVVVAASSGRTLGRIVLRWDGHKVLGADATLLRAYSDSLQVGPGDPIAALVDSMREVTRPLVGRVLGRAARPMRRAELANFVTDAMRSAVHADVAITNPGGLRRDFEAGPITVGDVFELMPFDNTLVTIRMTGAQLRAMLASRPEKALVSGLRGRAQAGAPGGLVLEHADGTPLKDDSTYVVVVNNFIAQGGDDFRGFEAGREMTLTPILVRDAIAQAIEATTRAGREVQADPEPRLVVPRSGSE